MSTVLHLHHEYEEHLQSAKPTKLRSTEVHPPPGTLGYIRTIPSQLIPPINTVAKFSSILPTFELKQNLGLAAMDHTKLPENFNWRHNGGKKSQLISKPGNQMLCGSCWAISTAGIVGDNHVVSNTVNWKPNLSTTWSLSCYPQKQCEGGNPAKLLQDIAKNGIATKNCVDYSWCNNSDSCNGKASKHFESTQNKNINLSTFIPNCGCYNSNNKHYLYSIEAPNLISIDKGGLNEDNFAITVKKHIYNYGPVQGGFIVFKNFRTGAFTKVNGGVYLETGVYDNKPIHFDNEQINTKTNYIGTHSIAIIGWGVEKNIIVDNNGVKKDVPYWYCRNSWTDKWGDGGYFKMAMYPFNKISQFDKIISLQAPSGMIEIGGMVIFRATKAPELKKLPKIQSKFLSIPKDKENSYYEIETQDKGDKGDKGDNTKIQKNQILKYVFIVLTVLVIITILFFLVRWLLSIIRRRINTVYVSKKGKVRRVVGSGREGSYLF